MRVHTHSPVCLMQPKPLQCRAVLAVSEAQECVAATLAVNSASTACEFAWFGVKGFTFAVSLSTPLHPCPTDHLSASLAPESL